MLGQVFEHRYSNWPACLFDLELKPKNHLPSWKAAWNFCIGNPQQKKCQREGHVPQANLKDASLSSSAGHALFRLGEIQHPENQAIHALSSQVWISQHVKILVLSSPDSYHSRISRKYIKNMNTVIENMCKWKANFWPLCGILPHTQEFLSESGNSWNLVEVILRSIHWNSPAECLCFRTMESSLSMRWPKRLLSSSLMAKQPFWKCHASQWPSIVSGHECGAKSQKVMKQPSTVAAA